MKKNHLLPVAFLFSFFFILFACDNGIETPSSSSSTDKLEDFRAPAYPLITHDPYFSIWMPHEDPTTMESMHWTQNRMPVNSMIRIDGEVFRLMGTSPAFIPAAKSTGARVYPTRTVFSFQQNGVEIELTFLSPILVEDLDLASRPLSYISWKCRSNDGEPHEVDVYFDISGLATVDHKRQRVVWEWKTLNDLQVLKIGHQDQPILEKSGDDVRIDWGYLYAAASMDDIKSAYAGRGEDVLVAFAEGKEFPAQSNAETGNTRYNTMRNLGAVLAFEFPMKVEPEEEAEQHVQVAYDDIYSVEYFGEWLEGYWKKKFEGIEQLLLTGADEYQSIKNRCLQYDKDLMDKARNAGGDQYAQLIALVYRQCMAAHKIVKDQNGEVLCFSKENHSNGSMGTVDVFYPASPFFLYLNPELLKAQTTPIFDYAISGRWPWRYAPHDIGLYPLGNGQTYGGGEESEDHQMPVEESGNMLILAGAIATVEGNADYAVKYWDVITQWAEFLKEKGFDPENQLCTDDFAGHLAHNVNLSMKAIMGIASYARLCELRGMEEEALLYKQTAESMVEKWMENADDGDHYRLAFDKPGTWSQKYNMVWDDLLKYHIIPEEVENKEIDYYLKVQNRYGLPLDSRETYTKLDWIFWCASMANSEEQFMELIKPAYRYVHETPERVPVSDWYWTKTAKWQNFIARSVVGALYMELLKDELR